MALNWLRYDQIDEDLLVHRLERLRKHLYPSEQPFSEANWKCRFAPSIIVRGEAEVFGLAMPRFAHRVYLSADPTDMSFVNARRISILKSASQLRTWGSRIDGRHRKVMALSDVKTCVEMMEAPERNPASQIADASPVADSYLKLPARFREKGYRALEVDLSVAYGETDLPDHSKFAATPYMRHIKLAGGGMCAQACCFMANSVLVNHSRHVSGLAEITALADDRFASFRERDAGEGGYDSLELKISGLTVEGVARYFHSVGLRATLQKDAHSLVARQVACGVGNREWGCALRAYLSSNMPVLLPVDLERMSGVTSAKTEEALADLGACLPVYARAASETRLSRELEPFEPARHANRPAPASHARHPSRHLVMLSGYDTKSPLNFLINDPAVLPFVEVTVGQLENCASYADPDLSRLNKREFITVCPSGCQLPLCYWKDPGPAAHGIALGRQEWEPGLASIIDALQSGLSGLDLPRVPKESRFEDIRLLTLEHARELAARNALACLATEDAEAFFKRLLSELGDTARRCNWSPDRYLWVQVARSRGTSVWIFDAARPLPGQEQRLARKARGEPERTDDEQHGFLRLVIECTGAGEIRVHSLPASVEGSPAAPACPQPIEDDDLGEAPAARRQIQASLITSTSICGTEEALNNWPDRSEHGEITCAEMYTFMNMDDWLADMSKFERGTLKPLYHRLFEMDDAAITSLADRVAREFAARNRKLVALASFIPEITDGNLTQSKIACGALGNLVRFGHAVNEVICSPRHEIGILELVAGSLVDGFWPGTVAGEHNPVYVANVSSRSAALRKLVQSLSDLRLDVLNKEKTPGIRLAFEYEPGAMCVLGDTGSLHALARRLREVCLQDVGFNLDISQWDFLGGITVDQLRSGAWRAVRHLLYHAHVSDHTRGHFGDCPPGWLHSKARFAGWFDLLSALPAFSGYVSLEMEAVKSRVILTSGAGAVLRLARDTSTPECP